MRKVGTKAGKKRGPGRPKGSKNKVKAKRGPGRPKGSKDKAPNISGANSLSEFVSLIRNLEKERDDALKALAKIRGVLD